MEREFPEEKIVSTLSRQLTEQFGKGYTKVGIFRMVKVARAFPDAEIVATLSHQLSWSLYIELIAISAPTKHLYFQQMSILYNWSVRQPYALRTGTGLWPYPSHACGEGPSRSRSRGRLRRPKATGYAVAMIK